MAGLKTNKPANSDTNFQISKDRLTRAQAHLREDIIPLLKARGIARFEAIYADDSDSPSVYGMRFQDAAGKPLKQRVIPAQFTEAIEHCLSITLPPNVIFGNDKYQGVFSVDVAKAAVKISHDEEFTERRRSTFEFTA